jgi:hypothetical protein
MGNVNAGDRDYDWVFFFTRRPASSRPGPVSIVSTRSAKYVIEMISSPCFVPFTRLARL